MIKLPATGYTLIRNKLFAGKLTQSQVNGIEFIIKAANDGGIVDKRHVAYMLATAYHETARTMRPVEEYGEGKGRAYGGWLKNSKGELYCWKNDSKTTVYLKKDCPYLMFGRGYVQLTWYDNYAIMAKLLGVDLVKNPSLACDPDIAAQIMVKGMVKGRFTGRKLSDYISSLKCDYVNARRIINGTDKAELIAEYARIFADALV